MLKNFKNKKITILGLGLLGGGIGAAKFFAKKGAKVTVTDIKSETDLRESVEKLKNYKIRFVLGKHHKDDFINADLIIKGPGIPDNSPYLQIAKSHNVPIDTDVGIFFEVCKSPIIGITGSKGKSTTAGLIKEVLRKRFKTVLLAGNIGISVFDIISKTKKDFPVVLELSSWQLEGLLQHRKSPHIAVITNIFPEHLNRYKNFQDYVEAKKIIYKFQKKKDFLIINRDLKKIISNIPSKVILFSGENSEPAKIIGKLYGISQKYIDKAIKNFVGLEGRLELVREKNGVKYYNDTCATHPKATIYSLTSIRQKDNPNKIILIAGGQDKNLDFKELNNNLPHLADNIILLPGSASDKITAKAHRVTDIEQAVSLTKSIAQKGDVVLLSPGAASFNLFKNEFDRGRQFKQLVKKI
jgi:UDP-N-acetylmuramoylalanine--D-glutamate ligase